MQKKPITFITSIVLITIFSLVIFYLDINPLNKLTKKSHMSDFSKHFPEATENGFAWPTVVSQGEEIDFFIHSLKAEIELEFRRLTDFKSEERAPIQSISVDSISSNLPTKCTSDNGCDWKSNYSLKIPAEWEPGYYIASFKDSNNHIKKIYFFVKTKQGYSDFLFLQDWMTFQAYNFYAGQNIYVHLKSDKILPNSKLEHEINSVYSLQRPLYPRTPSYGKSGSPDGLLPGLKDIYFGFSPLESLYRLNLKGQVLPNNFQMTNNQIDLKTFKTIVITGLQEYLSKEFLDDLRDYVQSGGNLIIASEEFAFRRIRSTEEKYEFYFNYKHDPMYPKFPEKIATHLAGQIDLTEYFGFTVGYGMSFGYISDNRSFSFIENEHPLVKPLLKKEVHINRYWSPGVLLKEGPTGKLCVQSKTIKCSDQVVLGVFTEKNLKKQTCCLEQKDFDLFMDGVVDKTLNQVNEEITMAFYWARYGKGNLVVAPYSKFFKGDLFYHWYPEFLKLVD